MQCTQCGQVNQLAKFCVKCGANLQAAAASEAANNDYRPTVQPLPQDQTSASQRPYQPHTYTGQSTPSTQPNSQLQQAKQMSKQYVSYFIEVLKSPVRTGQASNEGHMANGLVTMFLFALILPLIAYFQLRAFRSKFGEFANFTNEISFGSVVIKPFFLLLLVVLLVNSVIFLVLKLGNTTVNYREVTARFGTFMIPAVAFFLVALLFSFLDAFTVMGYLIGLGLFSWFVAICFVIYSFKKDHTTGLDAFYGVVITYVASIILLSILGDEVVPSLLNRFGSAFNL